MGSRRGLGGEWRRPGLELVAEEPTRCAFVAELSTGLKAPAGVEDVAHALERRCGEAFDLGQPLADRSPADREQHGEHREDG
jgi:hypothetical protein